MSKVCPVCQNEYPDEAELCPEDNSVLLVVQQGQEEEDPLLGQVVDGRYRIDSKLGVGGMGAVYLAVQLTMNRRVALKVLKPDLVSDPEVVKRFLREAQAVSLLTHANTITVYDFGQTPDDLLYLAMEYLDGRALSDAIVEDAPMSVERALGIVGDVAAALSEAHAKGIVHRDLKPDNIMLAEIGGQKDQVKVLDFGIAKLQSGRSQTQLTRAGYTVGTPDYMSPEQAQALPEITHRADLYALGCILYECLTGRPPFADESAVGVLMAHCTGEVPRFAEARPEISIPAEVEGLVRWLLEKQPEDRPDSAEVLVEKIRSMPLDGAPTPAAPPPPEVEELAFADTGPRPATTTTPVPTEAPPSEDAPAGRRPPILAIVAVLLLLGAGVGAAVLLSGDPPRQADAASPQPAVAETQRTGSGPPRPARRSWRGTRASARHPRGST